MSAENPLSTILDAAKTANEVLPQTTSETDGALSTLVGWFNNVVLYHVKKANITYRYKLEYFEEELKSKIIQIPQEHEHSPHLMIAGPTLEALKYAFDEEALREMYVNLLVSSMDARKDDIVHPSFVDIIRQLSPLDALFLQYLKGHRKALIDYECEAMIGNNLIHIPQEFEEYDVVKCINNYIRLGLFEKILTNRESCVFEFNQVEELAYKECKESIYEEFGREFTRVEFSESLKCRYYWLQLTNLGDDFIETCVE